MLFFVVLPAREEVVFVELISRLMLASLVMKTPSPAGLEFREEISPPNAPIEPAIDEYLAVPVMILLS